MSQAIVLYVSLNHFALLIPKSFCRYVQFEPIATEPHSPLAAAANRPASPRHQPASVPSEVIPRDGDQAARPPLGTRARPGDSAEPQKAGPQALPPRGRRLSLRPEMSSESTASASHAIPPGPAAANVAVSTRRPGPSESGRRASVLGLSAATASSLDDKASLSGGAVRLMCTGEGGCFWLAQVGSGSSPTRNQADVGGVGVRSAAGVGRLAQGRRRRGAIPRSAEERAAAATSRMVDMHATLRALAAEILPKQLDRPIRRATPQAAGVSEALEV